MVGGCGSSGESTVNVQPYLKYLKKERARKINALQDKVAAAEPQPGEQPSTSPDSGSGDAASDLDQLGDQLGAEVGATIGLPGAEPLVAGSLQSGSAWSTIKVPISMAVADQSKGLSASQRSLVTSAITLSDNEAAAELFSQLGDLGTATARVSDVLRSAGDDQTQVSTQGRDGFSTYGQTEWSLTEQQKFMGALLNGCIGDSASRSFILDQMGRVTSDTWGLGSAGVPALWKGGWGPGTDGRYLLRQMGAIDVGGNQYAVTLAVIPDNGDFVTGQGVASEVARWLVERAPAVGGSPGGC